MFFFKHPVQSVVVSIFAISLAGCAGSGVARTGMMPVPEAYRVLVGDTVETDTSLDSVPYATDRVRETDGTVYGNERGRFVRVGFAEVNVVGADSEKPVAESGPIRETGILQASVTPFDTLPPGELDPAQASRLFARQLGARLRQTGADDLVLYVPGFKVEFPDAVLVPAMFQRFSRAGTVFAGYSWPSTPSIFAYFRDLESTGYSARNLRLIIEYLANETSVRRIHILGFSAGTRLVVETLNALSLMRGPGGNTKALKRLRIGQVALVGSDLDRQQFGNALSDGLLDVAEGITVYMSGTDSALGFANFLFTRHRLGQLFEEETLEAGLRRYLVEARNLVLVDVTAAEGSRKANGHAYFRYSPWVSGDVLLTLLAAVPPAERGLVREPGGLIWRFPPDYIERIKILAAE